MSGIVGFVNKKDIDKEKIIHDMLRVISHRGNSEEDFYIGDHVAIGYNEMIINSSYKSNGIIYNEKGDKLIVFDGEVYNYQFLYEDLIVKGHKFKTNTSFEVVLHGYEEYGKDILCMLRGMFSFVIYDIVNDTFFGARDFYGIKPLYYYIGNKCFMFSSEIKSFLCNSSFKKEFNDSMLEKYLVFRNCVGDETFFKNVYKVSAGCYFFYKNGKFTIDKYYEFSFDIKQDKGFDKVVKDVRELLEDSVSVEDINLNEGCILNGNMEEVYIANLDHVKFGYNTYFDNKRYNNIENKTYNKLGVLVEEKKISSKELFDTFTSLQCYMDEPVSSYDLVFDYYNILGLKDKVDVILSGYGFDLFFGCYDNYLDYYSNRWYNGSFSFLRKVLGVIFSCFKDSKVSSFFVKYANRLEDGYIYDDTNFSDREIKKLLKNCSKKNIYRDVTKEYYDKVKKYSSIEKMQYIDYNLYFSNNLLSRIDKLGLINSVVIRFPYVDRMLVNYVRGINTKYKVNIKENVFNSSNAKDVNVFKKNNIHMKELLRERDTYDKIKSVFNYENKFFDSEELNRILISHMENKRDNSLMILTIYSFLVWYKEYFIDR